MREDEDVPPAPPWDAEDVPYDPEDDDGRPPPPVLRVVDPDEPATEDGKPDGAVWSVLAKNTRKGPDGAVIEGAPKPNVLNARLILTHDHRWRGRIGYDEWSARYVWADDVSPHLRAVRDDDITYMRCWISSVYGLDLQHQDVWRVVEIIGRECPVHELRDWLRSLEWDGVPRLCELWTRYFGAAEHALTATYGELWAVQAVARALTPGCDAQGMVVLVGAQGRGKTRGTHALAGTLADGRRLSVDLPSDRPVNDRDSIMAMRGAWIVNADELEALNRSGISAVKTWITATQDTFRAPYARTAETHKRHQVLIGSTNRHTFLADSSGARRFWVMELEGMVDVPAIERDRDQLWAEAAALHRAGVSWWLSATHTALQAEINAAWRVDGWHEAEIADYLRHRVNGAVVFVEDVLEHLAERHGLRMDQQQAAAKARATLEHLGCTWSGAKKLAHPRTGASRRYYVAPGRAP
jgi:putative DNA primase/helicase